MIKKIKNLTTKKLKLEIKYNKKAKKIFLFFLQKVIGKSSQRRNFAEEIKTQLMFLPLFCFVLIFKYL